MAAPQLHPWNVGFEWVDHTGPFTRVTEEQAAAFDESGFFVVDEVLDGDSLAQTLAEVDGFETETEAWLRTQKNERSMIAEAGAITFTTHLVERSPWLRDLSRSEILTDLCRDLIGPDVRLYWDQAVYKKPEKPRPFPWHQDNGYVYVEPQAYLTCWVALTDATVDNGCPWVVPGMHRMGTLRHSYVHPLGFECLSEPKGAVPAEVRSGGAVVFSSLTPHLTGPNSTGRTRKAYILQYAPDGALIQRGDPDAGPPETTEPASDPERQYPVVVGGERV